MLNLPPFARRASRACRIDRELAPNPFDRTLPAPPADAGRFSFGHRDLRRLRAFVVERAHGAGFDPTRVDDLALAVSEIATNCIRHGAGHGVAHIWRDDISVVCDVADEGDADWAPLVGRVAPSGDQPGGRGMWLANQLCDLVQICSGRDGTAVRLHLRAS